MFKKLLALAILSAGLCATTPASAGVYADDLGKCLVSATTPDDQRDLVLWVFAAIASHPDIQHYATITSDQQTAIIKKAAALVDRLVTVDCRKQAVDAIKYEGASAMEASFTTLGEIAMRGLMSEIGRAHV